MPPAKSTCSTGPKCCAERTCSTSRSFSHTLCKDVLQRTVTVERCNKCSRARFLVLLHDCSSSRQHVGYIKFIFRLCVYCLGYVFIV